jgi:putative protease
VASSDRSQHSNTPELLAPAGDSIALRAAVANGADAVYLGADRFNARRSAGNFSLSELAEATRYAHLRGVRVYLAANILILPDEMQDALSLVDEAWAAGVDAAIVQDIGLLSAIRGELPEVRIHASTQMGVHDSATAGVLSGLGVSRITLARETSIERMAAMARSTDIEIESFVHGALCFCYSGQCLMSSVIGGRSGNRGMCTQPCRMRYELFDADGERREVPGRHLLSPKDLAGIEVLPELISAGVSALKIEGRMKSPEYVALVTGVYRKALDRAAADPGLYSATEAERDTLLEAFTRGFSTAYLDGIDDDRMMSYTRPNDRGVLVGRVKEVAEGVATVALERAMDAEDTIEIWTRRGRFTQRVGEMVHRGNPLRHAPAGEDVGITVEEPASAGDRVFRVVAASLEAAARRTFEHDEHAPKVPADMHVSVVQGRPVSVTATVGDAEGTAEGPLVEAARTKVLTAEQVMEHVGRMGSTPFAAQSWDIELQPGAGLGYSVLHRTRREALDALEADMLKPWSARQASRPAIEFLSQPKQGSRSLARPSIVVRAMDADLAADMLVAGADVVFLPLGLTGGMPDEPDSRLALEMPRVAPDHEIETALAHVAEGQRVVATTLGLLAASVEKGAVAEAHWGLNATNPWSVDAMSRMGAERVWLSPELRLEQVADTIHSSAVSCGVAVYGRQELMVTQHCVLGVGGCTKACATCDIRGWSSLRDEKGYEFPVTSDLSGRSHIFNSLPLDVVHAMGEILDAGVDAVRIDLTTETAAESREVIGRVRAAADAAVARVDGPPRAEGTTTGHFFRGVQ